LISVPPVFANRCCALAGRILLRATGEEESDLGPFADRPADGHFKRIATHAVDRGGSTALVFRGPGRIV